MEWYTFEAAVAGSQAPQEVLDDLQLIEVPYNSFDNQVRTGQLLVHKDLAIELQSVFIEMFNLGFPIEKVIPVVAYGWDDEQSMLDNNTSAFNYRQVIATNDLSNHSLGRAVDINTRLNPYHARDGKVYTKGAVLNPDIPGTIAPGSPIIGLFKSYGWEWGGDWQDRRDYQHFQKL